jgi:hypothetical protein
MRRTLLSSVGAVLSAALTGGAVGAIGGALYGVLWGALLGAFLGELAKTLWCGVYFAALAAGSGALVVGLGRFLLGAEESGEDSRPAAGRRTGKAQTSLRPPTVPRTNGRAVPLHR